MTTFELQNTILYLFLIVNEVLSSQLKIDTGVLKYKSANFESWFLNNKNNIFKALYISNRHIKARKKI